MARRHHRCTVPPAQPPTWLFARKSRRVNASRSSRVIAAQPEARLLEISLTTAYDDFRHFSTAFDRFDTLRHFGQLPVGRFGQTGTALTMSQLPVVSLICPKHVYIFRTGRLKNLAEICAHISDKTRCRIEARASTSGGAFSTASSGTNPSRSGPRTTCSI